MKRLVLTFLLALVALAAPGIAHAEDSGQDNAAIAVNTKDGSSLFKLAFKIRRVAGDAVTATNAAVSYASCTSCRTTAIAFEIVLVTGNPSTVTPTNVAIAVNYECTLCQTFATAFQFVVSTGGPVRFTAEARQELAAIRKELRELKRADLDPAELDARTQALADRVKAVLATGLVKVGSEAEDEDELDESEETETTETVPTLPPTTTTAPAETVTTGTTTTTTTTPTTTTTGTTTTSGATETTTTGTTTG